MITFYQLESFCKIVEEGSFRAAAEKLFISQPSISQHVASLEKHFQTKLFTRRGRRIRLTPEGRLLYASAKEINEKIDGLAKRFRNLKNLKYGELKIGCSSFAGSYILPASLGLFRRKFPPISISVSSGKQEELARSLDKGDIELIIAERGLNRTGEASSTFKTVATEELFFVCADGYRPENGRTDVRALEAESFITFSEKHALNSYLRDFFLRHEIRPSNLIEVDSMDIGKKLALMGLGILMTGRTAVKEEMEDGRLRRIRLGEAEKLAWDICCSYHRERGLSYAGWEMLKILSNAPESIGARADDDHGKHETDR